MHKNTTVTLLMICTLLVSNWGLASIDGGSPAAGSRPGDALSQTLSSQDQAPGAGTLWLAQVGDLLRDTIRRQIRQRLETGEFEDKDFDDDDRVGDDVSNGNDNENDNSSPDDESQDNDDTSLDNSEDTSQDNNDDQSEDSSDNSGPGSSSVIRGPRGSFDSQF